MNLGFSMKHLAIIFLLCEFIFMQQAKKNVSKKTLKIVVIIRLWDILSPNTVSSLELFFDCNRGHSALLVSQKSTCVHSHRHRPGARYPPLRVSGLSLLVEDPAGDVVHLSLYRPASLPSSQWLRVAVGGIVCLPHGKQWPSTVFFSLASQSFSSDPQ